MPLSVRDTDFATPVRERDDIARHSSVDPSRSVAKMSRGERTRNRKHWRSAWKEGRSVAGPPFVRSASALRAEQR
jgi:hypothetical protein